MGNCQRVDLALHLERCDRYQGRIVMLVKGMCILYCGLFKISILFISTGDIMQKLSCSEQPPFDSI